MSALSPIEGRCMCGDVTVHATMADPIMRACRCDMCRQHTSSMFLSLTVDEGSLVFDGPVKTYRSSEWAERGFCETCGSTLFYGTIGDGVRRPAAGLFKDAAGAMLTGEYFTDNAPSYELSGTHTKMTTKETLALFAPELGENQ